MSTSNHPQTETLIARKTPWRKRLWVRISLLLAVLCVMLLGIWWWPRRGMVAVWQIGGSTTCDSNRQRTVETLEWLRAWGFNWHWIPFNIPGRISSGIPTDDAITNVHLQNAAVDDRFLVHLKHFSNLHSLDLHNRQLGPGLSDLQDHKMLRHLVIKSADSGHLSELHQLPQLTSVYLREPQTNDIDLAPLALLPNLKQLIIMDCGQTSELLARLPELPQLTLFSLKNCHGFTDEDLVHLKRLPNLWGLFIEQSSPIGVEGLIHISQLRSLEGLDLKQSLPSPIGNDELQVLRRFENLKGLEISRSAFTIEQQQSLQHSLPNARIGAY